MDPSAQDGNGAPEAPEVPEALPPPPPVPPNVTPTKVSEQEAKKVFRAPMARRGLGTKGNKVPILTNHFKVNVTNNDGQFFHYSVCMQLYLLFSTLKDGRSYVLFIPVSLNSDILYAIDT